MIIDKEHLLQFIRKQFKPDWGGLHGISHWARVNDNGIKLCTHYPDANNDVVELFAWLHDIGRETDGNDEFHGSTSAILIVDQILGQYVTLDDQQAEEELIIAIRDHSKGLTEGSITTQICWDADRLDLGRLGILPLPERLCTKYAKTAEMIRWSHARAIDNQYCFVDNNQIKY